MAIRIEERFVIEAPAAAVWEFLVDPRRVVSCVPGGELVRIVDASTFDGKIRVGIGPLVLAYGGRVRLAEVDAARRRVKIVGGARESAGTDSARLALESWVTPLLRGGTEVVALARVDVAGRIGELGRGVLEPLAHLVFQEFASCVSARVEAEEAGRVAGAATPPARVTGRGPLRPVPLVLRALRAWLASLLRSRARGAPPS